MKNTQFTLVIILLLGFIGCSPKRAEEAPQADSTAVAMVTSSASVENKNDSTHRFIRTADLKFRVKSVIKSTNYIEEITARQGGFVTYTNLTSNVDDFESKSVSRDSILITTRYTVTNSIILRVPNTRLDTTLKEIAKNIDFLDYRIIKADDIALQLLSNSLTMKRSSRNQARLTNAINNRGKKLNETTAAEELLLNKQEQADNAQLSTLSLQDKLNFSTINLTIYQRQTIKHDLIPNDDNNKKFEPGLGTKIVDALSMGWNILEGVLVFIISLWGLITLAIVVFLFYRIYRLKLKK